MLLSHGEMPYGPCTIATGQAESSKPIVFQPGGGEAGIPGNAFQVPSVTIRVVSSCATAITLLGVAVSAMPAIAMMVGPGTSSDLMLRTCDACHPLTTLPGALETSVPFTYVP